MNFLHLNNVWNATFLLTLMKTIELYSWCSVWVEKEGIQIVENAIGSVQKKCQGIGKTFQITNAKIHDLDIENYENQWKDAMNRYALTIALMHSKCRVALMHDRMVYLNAFVE